MAQRQVRINLLLALLALASKSKIEHSTPLSGQVVSTTCSQEFGCTKGSTAEEIHQGAATAHVDAAADWKINRSADSTLSSEDGIAVVLESGRDCTDRYEETSEPLRNFSSGSEIFATIGADLYRTLIQGTSELVRGTRPGGVRDPGDDPGDGRAGRLVELGVGDFSCGRSPRHDGSTKGSRGGCGRRGVVAAGNLPAAAARAVAAGNFPASTHVAIKARAILFSTLDLVGPPDPCDTLFNNIQACF